MLNVRYSFQRADGQARTEWATYTANLASLIAAGVTVKAMCVRCQRGRTVDLAVLLAEKGETYDLWGRRTRCRITVGCTGWNRFYFHGRGRFEPMRDG